MVGKLSTRLYTDKVNIQRISDNSVDERGLESTSWSTVTTNVKCHIQNLGSTENRQGRNTILTNFVIQIPSDTDIKASDRLQDCSNTSLYYANSQKLYTVSDGVFINDNLGIQDSIQHILDTNTNGELRAFVQTGVFEKVLPMDILPTFLFKAILANDYDEMEELGIYELLEEDIALCEFVDVSKNELQKLLRRGLNLLMED